MQVEISKEYEEYLNLVLEGMRIIDPRVFEGVTIETMVRAGALMVLLANTGMPEVPAMPVFAKSLVIQKASDLFEESPEEAEKDPETAQALELMHERLQAGLKVSNEFLQTFKDRREDADRKRKRKHNESGRDKSLWN